MKKIFIVIFCLTSYASQAQTEPPKLYNPDADAKKEIRAAVTKAAATKPNMRNSFTRSGVSSFS